MQPDASPVNTRDLELQIDSEATLSKSLSSLGATWHRSSASFENGS
jgi:hypothetical protein